MAIALQASQRFDVAEPTADDPDGDVTIVAFAADGTALTSIRMRTGTARECCAGSGLNDRSSFYAFLPETIGGRSIATIAIRDIASGKDLAEQVRSETPPKGSILGIGPVVAKPKAKAVAGKGVVAIGDGKGGPAAQGDPSTEEVEVTWTAEDADGDILEAQLLYSPDGGDRWVPVAVNLVPDPEAPLNTFRFAKSDVPSSVLTADGAASAGILKLRVSDGMNVDDVEFPSGMSLAGGSPPDVHVISPNNNVTVLQHASVVLQASAWDIDEQLLPEANVTWSSDRDGPLGSGRIFAIRTLSPGTHLLTLTGTDSTGLSTSRQVTVTVTPRAVRTSDLTFNGLVNANDLAILLGQWGQTGSFADLDLDGIVGATDLAIMLSDWS
jgi:hypothetical protein